MKKGQKVDYTKEVFQTGLTERSRGRDALTSFLNSQDCRTRQNIVRKKKKRK